MDFMQVSMTSILSEIFEFFLKLKNLLGLWGFDFYSNWCLEAKDMPSKT